MADASERPAASVLSSFKRPQKEKQAAFQVKEVWVYFNILENKQSTEDLGNVHDQSESSMQRKVNLIQIDWQMVSGEITPVCFEQLLLWNTRNETTMFLPPDYDLLAGSAAIWEVVFAVTELILGLNWIYSALSKNLKYPFFLHIQVPRGRAY